MHGRGENDGDSSVGEEMLHDQVPNEQSVREPLVMFAQDRTGVKDYISYRFSHLYYV